MAKKRVTEDGEVINVPDNETGIAVAARVDEMLAPANEYTPFFKTPWNHDTTYEAMRSGTVNLEPTKTQQHQAEETNINVIMKKFGVTGVLPIARLPPSFMDVPDGLDAATARRMLMEGEEAFYQLPAEIRETFGNDLARYMGYVDQRLAAGDTETLRRLGLDIPAPPGAAPAPGQEAAKKD